MEVLFESRIEIESVAGKLRAIQAQPQYHPEVVVPRDTFVDRAGTSIWGTVLKDGGRYRMWYQPWPEDWDGRDVSLVGYAESDDGLSWDKKPLGLVDYGPSPNHLCDLGLHCPSVFVDPQAQSSHRYRAVGCANPGSTGTRLRPDQQRGYYTAHSSDGLHWEYDAETPTWQGADTLKSVWHPVQQRGIITLKRSVRYQGFRRRSLWQAECVDGAYAPAVRALVPDNFDDIRASSGGFASADYYSMSLLPAGAGTVGFVEQFRHALPRTGGWDTGVFGSTAISLTYQEERGACWQHAPGRPDFLTPGALPWAPGGYYLSSAPVEVGDEHWLYFAGDPTAHGWYLDAEWNRLDRRMAELVELGLSEIGMAHFPKYRLFGFESMPEGVLTLDLGPLDSPCELVLNCKTFHDGCIRVEQLDECDQVYATSQPLAGDHSGVVVTWREGAVIQSGERALRLRFHLETAELWAYELRPVP